MKGVVMFFTLCCAETTVVDLYQTCKQINFNNLRKMKDMTMVFTQVCTYGFSFNYFLHFIGNHIKTVAYLIAIFT